MTSQSSAITGFNFIPMRMTSSTHYDIMRVQLQQCTLTIGYLLRHTPTYGVLKVHSCWLTLLVWRWWEVHARWWHSSYIKKETVSKESKELTGRKGNLAEVVHEAEEHVRSACLHCASVVAVAVAAAAAAVDSWVAFLSPRHNCQRVVVAAVDMTWSIGLSNAKK